MPTYSYQCSLCNNSIEEFQKITDDPLTVCPKCKKTSLQRGIGGGSATFRFEGSGFYITDYKKDDKKASSADCACGKNACSKA